jgi:hypothetical protein
VARLKDRNTEIENGWTYVQPETGERINCHGENLGALVDLVIAHRKFKGLKPDTREGVQIDVERQLCMGVEKGCQPEPGDVTYKDQYRGITGDTIIAASKALFSFLRGGGQLVPKAESERRAQICRGCKFNRLAGTCMCNTVFAMIKSLIPSNRIEPGLKACGICGCANEAKVLAPSSVLKDSEPTPPRLYPPWCWMNQIS